MPTQQLVPHAVRDWSRLVAGLADTAAAIAIPEGSERPPTFVMCERMIVRAAKEAAGALAWAGHPLDLGKLASGAGGKQRAAFATSAELAAVPATVPVAFAQVQRAFAADEDRSAALVAMFLEAGRRAEALVEQLELAAQAEPDAKIAAETLAAALPLAGFREFRPRVRTAADFDRMRAIGYLDSGSLPSGSSTTTNEHLAGRVAEVKRTGLAWQGHVLRKADVIVFEAG